MDITPLPETVALVLHFRNAATTAACLYSLFADDVGRLALVDNSEDAGVSLHTLSQDIECLRTAGMAITVIEPGRNLGFSAGVNRGLMAIREIYGEACVLLMNSDAQLFKGAHQCLRRALGCEHGTSIIAPLLEAPDGSRKAYGYYHRLTGLLVERPIWGAFKHLSGCCLLLPPTLVGAPLFDEDFFFFGDDAELGWRLANAGVSLKIAQDVHVLHAGSGSSRNGSFFYEYHMARAHLVLTRKLGGGAFSRGLMLLGRALTLPLRAFVRSIRFHSLTPWRALRIALVDFVFNRCQHFTPPVE